jgi:hypothetical protein
MGMRTRADIESEMKELTANASGDISPTTSNMWETQMEVLLDIRDLLAANPALKPITPNPVMPADSTFSGKPLTGFTEPPIFPDPYAKMLNTTEEKGYYKVSFLRFAEREDFAGVAKLVRDFGGEYISAGKDSHFRIPRK